MGTKPGTTNRDATRNFKINVNVEELIYDVVRIVADKQGVSISSIMRKAVIAYLLKEGFINQEDILSLVNGE